MIDIKAADVAKLRKQTGAGMMDCKIALVEANGDFDVAINILRKKGKKIAANRADRHAREGVAITKINTEKTKGVAIVLACETDFVAKNDSFKELANQLANIALDYKDKGSFMSANFDKTTVSEKLIEQTGVIGEKLDISAFEGVEANYVGSYMHGVKIAVLVGLDNKVDNAEILAKDLAMQVASMSATTLSYKDFDLPFVSSETEARIAIIKKENIELIKLGKTPKNVPKYSSMAQLTDDVLSEVKTEIENQLKAEGKSENILEKIISGKMERFITDNTTLDKEQCLLDQNFIKDEKKSVAEYMQTYGNVKVTSFKRVALG